MGCDQRRQRHPGRGRTALLVRTRRRDNHQAVEEQLERLAEWIDSFTAAHVRQPVLRQLRLETQEGKQPQSLLPVHLPNQPSSPSATTVALTAATATATVSTTVTIPPTDNLLTDKQPRYNSR